MRLLKYLVQAVVLEEDEDGVILGERLSEPTAIYSNAQMQEYMAKVEAQLRNGSEAPE